MSNKIHLIEDMLDNKANVQITPDVTTKSQFGQPLLVLRVQGEVIGSFDTYTAAADALIYFVNDGASDEIDHLLSDQGLMSRTRP